MAKKKQSKASKAPIKSEEKVVEVTPKGTDDSKPSKSKGFFKRNKRKIIITSLILIIVAMIVAFVKPLRYGFLNIFSSETVNIYVVDKDTMQPLNNVAVSLNGAPVGLTDDSGNASISNVSYGETSVSLEREAYEATTFNYEVMLGENNIGPEELVPIGIPVNVTVTNTISGQPIAGNRVEQLDSQLAFVGDDNGKTTLNVPPYIGQKVTLKISAEGFNEKVVSFTVEEKNDPINVKLTPAGKHYYLSNRNGTIDIYGSNLDGSEEELIIAGTGSENQGQTSMYVSPDSQTAALISTRDNLRNEDGIVQSALYMVNLNDKSIARVDDGARQFIGRGWVDGKFLYYITKDNYTSNENTKIKTSTPDGQLNTLVTTQSIGHINNADNTVLYSTYDNQSYTYTLFKVDINDGGQKSKLLDQSVSTIYRTGVNDFVIVDNDNQYYSYNVLSGSVEKLPAAPSPLVSKSYIVNPSSTAAAWKDVRDGKGVIIVQNIDGSDEKKVTINENVTSVLNWINDDLLVVRATNSSSETADYVVDLSAQKAIKVSNVYTPQRYGYH